MGAATRCRPAVDEERRLRSGRCCGRTPGEREAVGAREVEHLHRRRRRARPDDLQPDPLHALERLPAGDEGREDEVAQRAVVEQEGAQRVALDRDIAERFRHDRRQEDGLPGEQVELADEAGGAVADDLAAGRVEDGDLARADGDERIDGDLRRGTARRRRLRSALRPPRRGSPAARTTARGWRELPSDERSRAFSPQRARLGRRRRCPHSCWRGRRCPSRPRATP